MGRRIATPVFAKDPLEATLLRSELVPSNPHKPLGSAGYQLLTTLAERQLVLGQSAVLDSVASTQSIQNTRKLLAEQYRVEWRVNECTCFDEAIHRSRLDRRERKFPGWHELDWLPWMGERLILDMADPLEHNIVSDLIVRYNTICQTT